MARSKPDKTKGAKAKASGNGHGDKPKTTRKKGGRRPEGGMGLRDDERQALHFRHVKEFEAAQDVKKQGDKDFKSVKDRIKEEGGSIKAIELTLALRTEEGQQAFQARIAEEAEVAKWNGVGVQLQMFASASEDVIFEDGKRAAMQDEKAKPPGHLGDKAQQRWLAGHSAGRIALNTTRAEGFKPLGEVVGDLAEKAGIAASLGTQAPSYQEAH